MTPGAKAAEIGYGYYQANLRNAEVRISETFCSDRDLVSTREGRVVYPEQVRRDWSPIVVATGSVVLNLTADLKVISIE